MKLSVYGLSHQLLGSVEVPVNDNTSVDQFIGIESTIPFTEAVFQTVTSSGLPGTVFAVVIDNLSFSAVGSVPDGSSDLVMLGVAIAGLEFLRRKL
jgi:hypothetical protein